MKPEKELQECKDAMCVKEEILKNYPLADEEKDTIFIIDTETGGLNPELHALLDIHLKSLQSNYERTFRLVPMRSISHEALCVNKLNWIDLVNRSQDETMKEISDLANIFKRKIIVIGHNIDFDIKFIEKNIIRNLLCYSIDTRLLAKIMYPELKDYSLKNLSKGIVGEYDEEKAHTAKYDCYLTENLLKKMIQEDTENKLNLKWLAMELKNLSE